MKDIPLEGRESGIQDLITNVNSLFDAKMTELSKNEEAVNRLSQDWGGLQTFASGTDKEAAKRKIREISAAQFAVSRKNVDSEKPDALRNFLAETNSLVLAPLDTHTSLDDTSLRNAARARVRLLEIVRTRQQDILAIIDKGGFQ